VKGKESMTYSEKSAQLTLDSSVAVMVLMGAPNDVEFLPLKPRVADEKMLSELRGRWPGRGLRSIGIVGLVGVTPRAALKESLEPMQVDALAAAFLTYVNTLLRGEQPSAEVERKHAGDFVQFAESLWALEDTRPEKFN
jgi:hypothetical protein